MKHIYIEDCNVIREEKTEKTYLVYKETQETVFSIRGLDISTSRLEEILRVYNAGLTAGVRFGRAEVRSEIKKALGIYEA